MASGRRSVAREEALRHLIIRGGEFDLEPRGLLVRTTTMSKPTRIIVHAKIVGEDPKRWTRRWEDTAKGMVRTLLQEHNLVPTDIHLTGITAMGGLAQVRLGVWLSPDADKQTVESVKPLLQDAYQEMVEDTVALAQLRAYKDFRRWKTETEAAINEANTAIQKLDELLHEGVDGVDKAAKLVEGLKTLGAVGSRVIQALSLLGQ